MAMVEFFREDKREPALLAAPCRCLTTMASFGHKVLLFVIVVESFIGPQKLNNFVTAFQATNQRHDSRVDMRIRRSSSSIGLAFSVVFTFEFFTVRT